MQYNKTYNLNSTVLVQILPWAMEQLRKDNGDAFIEHVIESRKIEIDGNIWYELQLHSVMSYFGPMIVDSKPPIEPNILLNLP